LGADTAEVLAEIGTSSPPQGGGTPTKIARNGLPEGDFAVPRKAVPPAREVKEI
jgi:hypothetical protein